MTVSVSPASVPSPAVGEQLTLSLNIANGENVAGYQGTVVFDPSALRYVESANGDYLKAGAFFVLPVLDGNRVTLASSAINAVSNGDGTLATITFEVVEVKASAVTLSEAALLPNYPNPFNPETWIPYQLAADSDVTLTIGYLNRVVKSPNAGAVDDALNSSHALSIDSLSS